MFEKSNHDYSNTCAKLAAAINDLDVRIRVSEQNQKLKDTYSEKIKTLEDNILLCNGVLNQLKPMHEDVQKYITERRKNSMQNINNALRMSEEIIQDASEGIYFHLEGDEAWLSTPDGLEVDIAEGGGYRQISSAFVRTVVIGANNDKLKTLMLDEVFSLVSPENSTVLSLYLNVICQDKQIISIEQKPQVYSNIDSVTYLFSKNNNYTEVTKKIIKRGEMEQEKGGTSESI